MIQISNFLIGFFIGFMIALIGIGIVESREDNK